MRVGIVAEGRGDLAVLVNILKGQLGLQLRKLLNKTMPDKQRKRHFQLKEYDQAHALTRPFRKLRDLERFAEQNRSLRLFLDALGEPGAGAP